MKNYFVFVLCLAMISCSSKRKATTQLNLGSTEDHQSFSKPGDARVKHLDLVLDVNFTTKQLTGEATWTINDSLSADSIIFDTKQLEITRVSTGDDDRETTFTLSPEVPFMGNRLSIKLKPGCKKVNIYYKTSVGAAALQWLDPQQTAGKKQPFLFTQSQAILARSWVPCQDGPGVRFTYNAKVKVPKNLLALMSAENPQSKNKEGVYEFKQPNPIPSYLLALAVGDIAFKAIDNRTGVYAEPVVLDKVAWEFADMGKMVTAAEKLYGPYKWGRYDLLVLPPSFPFGGMENPMLTFATPTVIAGDRSLVSLVAHELAHSWSGNLVTNATWNDFWLNEGFTTYFERRIIESLYGVEEREMQEALGYQDLLVEMETLGDSSPDTRLKLDLNGRDPDLGVSSIAYEKGYFFLKKIEEVVGRPTFDSLVNGYFTRYQFQSVTTENFLNYLDENLLKKDPSLAEKLDVDLWVYQPGLPANFPKLRSAKFAMIDSLIHNWSETKSLTLLSSNLKTTNEKLYFIKHLPAGISTTDMAALDQVFNFTNSGNAEIQCAWYTLAVRKNYQPAFANMETFLINVGRRKFLTPIYKELIKTAAGKATAKRIYTKARPNYHSVAYNTVDDLLK